MHPDEQVITGEAVAVDLRLAGAGSRGIAALIDIVIVTVVQLILLLFIVDTNFDNTDAVITVLIATEVLLILGYPVAMETLWRGRTLGKAIMGLRVVRDDGGPIRFRHAFVRGLVGVVLDKPGLSSGLLAFIPMMAGSRNKRLGDLAAGTIVLQDRVPGRIETPIAMPPQLAGWAAGLDLSAVDDGLALRMRHFLGRASQLTPDARATLEHQLAGEAVARVGAPPLGTPGWAIITAVLAERRRRAFEATQPAAQPWPPSAAAGLPAYPAPWTPAPPMPSIPPSAPMAGAPPSPIADALLPTPPAKPALTETESESADPPPSPTGFAPPG
jgi:uncharacterized RDD family membrane protein YckC